MSSAHARRIFNTLLWGAMSNEQATDAGPPSFWDRFWSSKTLAVLWAWAFLCAVGEHGWRGYLLAFLVVYVAIALSLALSWYFERRQRVVLLLPVTVVLVWWWAGQLQLHLGCGRD